MIRTIIPALSVILMATHTQAAGFDVYSGPMPDSAQTIHHCGYLQPGKMAGFGFASYTDTPLTARIVQQKLESLGYYRAGVDGKFGPASKAATRAFQQDSGLPSTGHVDGETAARLGFATHPAGNVQRCYRTASTLWRAF